MKLVLGMLVLVVCANSGCQRTPYEVAPVRGTVTVDGQPLEGGRVVFAPISREGVHAGNVAFGDVQPDGSFTLTTYRSGDGAVVGDHWVTLFPPDPLPAKFKLPKFLRFTVREKQSVLAGQENVIDLRLSSQEIARYAAR